MTTEHLAKLQAGRAAAQAVKQSAAQTEEELFAVRHTQAYNDLLRYRAEEELRKAERLESEWLKI
jgi:hypothetical protein